WSRPRHGDRIATRPRRTRSCSASPTSQCCASSASTGRRARRQASRSPHERSDVRYYGAKTTSDRVAAARERGGIWRCALAALFVSAVFLKAPLMAQDYEVADVYVGLRNMVLQTKPEQIGIKDSSTGAVWGLLMETGYPQAVASLVALADGTVSLYFSNGGGSIGLGPHPGPKRVSQELLKLAPQFLQYCQPAQEFPLPSRSRTRFYLLTRDGIVTAEAEEEELGRRRHPLSPLFHKAHEL